MAIKSAWAHKNGLAILNESMRIAADKEAERRHDAFALKATNADSVQEVKEKAGAKLSEMFDALKVGDSLLPFGINVIVEKKNKKSVLTYDSKYTKQELTWAF